MFYNKRSHWSFLVIVSTVVVISLSYHLQTTQFSTTARAITKTIPAGDLSVVGRPSLPAATVNTIFKNLGSPMLGTGQIVEQASQQTNIDDAFALAVWWTETNDGAAGVGLADRNPGSVRGSIGYPSAFDGYTIYPSYSAAIVYWFNMLKNRYVDQGLNTVYLISRPYVGTASSPLWAGKVVALMLKYRGEAPLHPSVASYAKRGASASVYINIIPASFLHLQQERSLMLNMRKNQPTLIRKQVDTTSTSSVTNAVVVLALLLALAIVLSVFWLEKRSIRSAAQIQANDAKIPVKSARYAQPDDVIAQDKYFLTQGKLLLPSLPVSDPTKLGESAVNNTSRERSAGLLSRYRETHQ